MTEISGKVRLDKEMGNTESFMLVAVFQWHLLMCYFMDKANERGALAWMGESRDIDTQQSTLVARTVSPEGHCHHLGWVYWNANSCKLDLFLQVENLSSILPGKVIGSCLLTLYPARESDWLCLLTLYPARESDWILSFNFVSYHRAVTHS